MREIKRVGVLVCVVGGMISTTPAIAVTTQSDNTGTNVWNNTLPRFGPGRLDETDIFNNARRISQEIDRANEACAAARAAAARQPRRFARGPGDSTAVCNSPECQRLNSLLEEARTFLNSLDSTQAARLKASRALRIW